MKTTKRSAKPAKPSTRGRFDLTERKRPWRRLISFPGVKGKVAKAARLFTTGGCHSITLEFQDKTALHFDIEPGLTFYADYYDGKTGNVRVLKRWPPIRSQGLRTP
ncbi:MAG TPA: hypothetical protein VKY85_05915 [Candidatus Angelobacter sp.]|nr:hypothetical protein [Candidatus Angelobacter sp.]